VKLHEAIFLAGWAVALSGCGGDPGPMTPADAPDPHLWLEDVHGEKALAWVRERNAEAQKELERRAEFEGIRERLLSIMDSRERIPHVGKHGGMFYNYWKDAKNPRGVWRRTTLDEYRKAAPAWETVLDVDALAAAEKENWVWHGAQILHPDDDLCMVALSRGGTDASVHREFDLKRKEFVKDGFFLPEAKSNLAWRDRNTLYVGTEFGPGSMTSSGYPRIVKEWKRGTPLGGAATVFEGKADDVSTSPAVDRHHGFAYEFARRAPTFFTNETFVRRGDLFVRVDKPDDADVAAFGPWLLFTLRTDWTLGGRTFRGGSLLAADFEGWMKGGRDVAVVFEPTPRSSLQYMSETKNFVVLNTLENVRSRILLARVENGRWTTEPVDAPEFGDVDVHGIDADESDEYFMTVTDFLTPSSLWMGTAGRAEREKLKSLPVCFRSEGLEIGQFEAVSKDGTRVPYFLVGRKGLALDGKNPTLLYGYGGFEIPMLPSYASGLGAAWLERGGTYALANIRGGGEFGPSWHNAARKENRQRAFDDFIAVAEDLIARKVTSPRHLGISGRSNGGLLMGAMLTQRPDLFRAVACGNPLLDMRRYHRMLAGASWMDEYGDPDKPEEWAYIGRYSPYQNLRKDRAYPRILFTTSTRDDRVHPGHARKMFARMREMGHDALYYENIEGGHGSAANNRQSAFMEALVYTFFWKELR
jgi:prolyl oligopeptidase